MHVPYSLRPTLTYEVWTTNYELKLASNLSIRGGAPWTANFLLGSEFIIATKSHFSAFGCRRLAVISACKSQLARPVPSRTSTKVMFCVHAPTFITSSLSLLGEEKYGLMARASSMFCPCAVRIS